MPQRIVNVLNAALMSASLPISGPWTERVQCDAMCQKPPLAAVAVGRPIATGAHAWGARSVTSHLFSRLFAGVVIRCLNCLQYAVQVVGLRRLQGWEGLIGQTRVRGLELANVSLKKLLVANAPEPRTCQPMRLALYAPARSSARRMSVCGAHSGCKLGVSGAGFYAPKCCQSSLELTRFCRDIRRELPEKPQRWLLGGT